jgi:hypothetical protein
MDRLTREHARLIILRALAQEVNGSLNSAILQDHLTTFGIARPRDWLHEELRWLAEIGAIVVLEAGTVRVATLTAKGADHVERRTAIEGVKRPSIGS